MARYTTKRKYTKKPTGTKKVIKKITKKEITESTRKTVKKKSLWQKCVDWVKGLVK